MQNVKGTSDFRAEEQVLRNRIRTVLEQQFELYDFEPLETPILNEQSLLASKYAGGEEIMQEMYRLSDQGGRSLGLRYDLTVPFAKVVAMSPGLEMPYKRYEIGKVFRDGPVKRGRLREFTQCDADVAGIEGPEAEAELMQLASDVFRSLEIDIAVRWNNRRFLGELLASVGVGEELQLSVMLSLDKLDKIGADGVADELRNKRLDPETVECIIGLIQEEAPEFDDLVKRFGLADTIGTQEVQNLQTLLTNTGLERICRFDPFLSRGLSFYTGTVYELFAADGSCSSSLGGGGRYDSIIGKLVGREDAATYPAVGLSFGLDSIMELWTARGRSSNTQPVRFVPIGNTIAETLRSAALFRAAGIRARVESGTRKLKRAMASAASKGTKYVVLIGEDEAAAGQVRLKNMQTGEETVGAVEQVLHIVEKSEGL